MKCILVLTSSVGTGGSDSKLKMIASRIYTGSRVIYSVIIIMEIETLR